MSSDDVDSVFFKYRLLAAESVRLIVVCNMCSVPFSVHAMETFIIYQQFVKHRYTMGVLGEMHGHNETHYFECSAISILDRLFSTCAIFLFNPCLFQLTTDSSTVITA